MPLHRYLPHLRDDFPWLWATHLRHQSRSPPSHFPLGKSLQPIRYPGNHVEQNLVRSHPIPYQRVPDADRALLHHGHGLFWPEHLGVDGLDSMQADCEDLGLLAQRDLLESSSICYSGHCGWRFVRSGVFCEQQLTSTVPAYSGCMDMLLALLPWKMVRKLQIEKREKVAIALAMSMGVL